MSNCAQFRCWDFSLTSKPNFSERLNGRVLIKCCPARLLQNTCPKSYAVKRLTGDGVLLLNRARDPHESYVPRPIILRPRCRIWIDHGVGSCRQCDSGMTFPVHVGGSARTCAGNYGPRAIHLSRTVLQADSFRG